MAIYRQIHIKIWSSPDFQQLSPHGKLVFIYLFSNSHRNEACLYKITPKTISNETDLTIEQVNEVISEIENAGMVKYDRDNFILWVINAVKYQKLNTNEKKGILNSLKPIKDHPFYNEFMDKYSEVFESLPKSSEDDIKSSGKGKGKGKDKGKDKGNNTSIDTFNISSSRSNSNDTGEKANKYLATAAAENHLCTTNFPANSSVLKSFEREFGRPLSPMEIEFITNWEKTFDGDVILEALCRAVMQGKFKMGYIDGILLDWHKQNLRTIKEILDKDPRNRKVDTATEEANLPPVKTYTRNQLLRPRPKERTPT